MSVSVADWTKARLNNEPAVESGMMWEMSKSVVSPVEAVIVDLVDISRCLDAE